LPSALYLDLTHLSARLWTDAPAGIDRVDRTFAELMTHPGSGFIEGVHQGLRGPRAVSPGRAAALLRRIDARWHEGGDPAGDKAFTAIARWLGAPPDRRGNGASRFDGARKQLQRRLRLHTLYRHSFASGPAAFRGAPPGSVYLNIAQWALGEPERYDWLGRQQLKPVFFVHDTLPLDLPDYFPSHVPAQHRRIPETLVMHARGLITASRDVAERIAARMKPLTASLPPILVAPPPAFEAAQAAPRFDPVLAAKPYFVAVGTIEPRKNHMLLLNLWREMAAVGGDLPRLVLIGARGWGNAEIIETLANTPALAGHVAEINGLSSSAMRSLVAHAAGLLFPSFAEGFGLPLAEAIALGTPAVASDIPVLRDTAGGGAIFAGPHDGPAWREAIERLSAAHHAGTIEARIMSAAARPSGHDAFFDRVLDFLGGL